ncbi:RYR3 protein, partial [Hippolais icterina]|nr:RYR3 protein [Hippolais icterina]
TLKELISQTMVRWSQEDQIQDPELVRIMYSLLRRQYDSIGELLQALRKAYTISAASVKDTINLLAALGQIRSLLSVRMGKEEELLMINGLGSLFLRWWQAVVGSCATSVALVVKTKRPCLSISVTYWKTAVLDWVCLVAATPKSKTVARWVQWSSLPLGSGGKARCLLLLGLSLYLGRNGWLSPPHWVEQLTMGWCNVVTYLAGCGLQSCPVLLAKGYPDIGWNPIEGERYLSFLRFAVFANSESVEENASVVVKLLIR